MEVIAVSWFVQVDMDEVAADLFRQEKKAYAAYRATRAHEETILANMNLLDGRSKRDKVSPKAKKDGKVIWRVLDTFRPQGEMR